MATPQTGAGDPKRSLELLWRDLEPQPSRPGPKPKLSVDEIVDAAIRVADREGSCFSMRGVAAELGVGTMTIYRYIPGKAELLDLMVDKAGEPGTDTTETERRGWRHILEQLADHSLEFYRLHPWMLEINQRRPTLGPGGLGGINFALAAFDDHDVTDKEAILIINAVWNIVTGTALAFLTNDTPTERGGPITTEEEWWEIQEPFLMRAVESGRFPRLARIEDHTIWDMTAQEAMRHALDAYLDGIAPRMEETRRVKD
ncbi:TetR/AcrR family transcriptional regulator [Glycomyces tenuis]|uniref:TetR/AcrR family transcriptional regulator n=1 Tax=Glycomyces tenuis TaxID=58116 RepID=UPI000402315B|nr:TetR/AcrR family transcriptional regulator [Glycomyces tenuis]